MHTEISGLAYTPPPLPPAPLPVPAKRVYAPMKIAVIRRNPSLLGGCGSCGGRSGLGSARGSLPDGGRGTACRPAGALASEARGAPRMHRSGGMPAAVTGRGGSRVRSPKKRKKMARPAPPSSRYGRWRGREERVRKVGLEEPTGLILCLRINAAMARDSFRRSL